MLWNVICVFLLPLITRVCNSVHWSDIGSICTRRKTPRTWANVGLESARPGTRGSASKRAAVSCVMLLNSTHLRYVPTFSAIVLASSLLRIALIVYSEWHDAHSVVKYTDVDYRVFSDAARFVLRPSPDNYAEGPLAGYVSLGRWVCTLSSAECSLTRLPTPSPYTRATYRYTPLLAILLAPNEWLHPSFGKFLFAACDILAGVLMYNLLVSDILPYTAPAPASNEEKTCSLDAGEQLRRRATLLVSLHLLSPLVFTISTRGSSESVLALFVLATLHCALRNRWVAAAVLLGLSAHWKIYPFVYGAACVGVVGGAKSARRGVAGYVRSSVNARSVCFGLLSGATFVALGAVMYAM